MSKLQYIPINEKKIPLVPEWQTSDLIHDTSKSYGVGIVCGKLSGSLEAIDLDLKYDLTGTLFARYKAAINEVAPDLLKKLTVQSTKSKGYHFIYRCSQIEGNLKLAQRYANDDEKLKGEKIKVLLETRGEGGYIAAYPTPGYKMVYGSFETIQEITPEEREILISVARSFNEVLKESRPDIPKKLKMKGQTPFEDYNSRADVVGLLEKHGWTVCGNKSGKVLLKRPGQTTAAHSGNFDTDRNWFSVFSTSTEFEPEKAYLPYAVFAKLECQDDFSEAARKLYEMDYGDRREEAKHNEVKVSTRIDELDPSNDFVAKPVDYDDYLKQWRSGTFKMGKSTGFSVLDEYLRHKDNTLFMANGLDNVGKSTFLWYLLLLASMLHNEKMIIISSENSVGTVMRKLIEFFWCETIDKISDEKYAQAKTHIEAHFAIIKSDDALFNYKDVLAIIKKLLSEGYTRALIDPYNGLVIDLSEKSKLSTHEYHYQAASEFKLFTKQNPISLYLNMHVVTVATRVEKGQKFIQAPRKADTEGGSKFPNKADDFITIHRHVEDPENFMWTEIHVRKVKETETGGRVTFYDSPVKLRCVVGLCGFEDENGFNPVLSIHSGLFHHQPLPKQKPATNFYEVEKETLEETGPAPF